MTVDKLEEIRLESMKQNGFGVAVMMQTKVCEKCGRMLPASEFFCTACGTRLSEDTLFHVYKRKHKSCPVCDTVVCTDARYCPQCGKELLERQK